MVSSTGLPVQRIFSSWPCTRGWPTDRRCDMHDMMCDMCDMHDMYICPAINPFLLNDFFLNPSSASLITTQPDRSCINVMWYDVLWYILMHWYDVIWPYDVMWPFPQDKKPLEQGKPGLVTMSLADHTESGEPLPLLLGDLTPQTYTSDEQGLEESNLKRDR